MRWRLPHPGPWAAAATLLACSSAVVRLPAPLPATPPGLSPSDPSRGQALLSDRTRSRSGLACADCHRLNPADPIRPAPDLFDARAREALWRGRATDVGQAIGLCAERYQARTLPDAEVEALWAALEAPGPARPQTGDPYDQACRHCHEDGPAGPLLGRPWPHRVVEDQLRGWAGPKAPDRFMPRFAPAVLSQRALSAVLDRLDQAGRPRVGRDQDE